MIILDVEQGSPEWIAARVGLPTASNFKRLITKTGKASASADGYLHRLIAEWFIGDTLDDDAAQTRMMERGSVLESSAVSLYEFEADADCTLCGLCLSDDRRIACSPDRLVGEVGLLEIKCPNPEDHMGLYLDGFTDDYKPQVQGQLLVTDREWVDLMSYNPMLPRALVRCYRDKGYIAALWNILDPFLDRLAEAKVRLAGAKGERDERSKQEAEDASHIF